MELDLTEILRSWPHEAGSIQVRKITGDDAREKLQLRLDLGIIQMEMDGRPDGSRPHGFESLLEWHKHEAAQAHADGRQYMLSEQDASDLQQEGIQYYHRYVSLMQIEDYTHVVRDTERNLRLFDFVQAYAPDPEIAGAFTQFRPYVIMMRARALGSIAADAGRFEEAVEIVENACEEIRKINGDESEEEISEISFLKDWLQELRDKKPLSEREKMENKMNLAIRNEAYEEAAKLRDAIRALDKSSIK